MRVMIVDDSIVFRSQIKAALEGVAGLTVMGSASNGKIALDFIELNPCDLLILDLEMPVLNGLETLAELKRRNLPQKVIVFAAPTQDGARQVFDAFNLGAVDFIAKPASPKSLEEALIGIKRDLIPKILQFVKLQSPRALAAPLQQKKVNLDHLPLSSATKDFYVKVNLEQFKPRIIAIGCSTGGPLALETIFSTLKDRALTLPILIVQHMPPHFTECLAKRLESLSGIPAAEGRDGEPIQSGRIYIAPGDYHMSVRRKPDGTEVIIKLDQGKALLRSPLRG